MTPAEATTLQRRVTGAASKVRGESLERELDAYHLDLARRGVAFVRRVGTPVKVLGKVRRDARGRWYFRAAFDGPQGCDFAGYVCGDAVAEWLALGHGGEAGTYSLSCPSRPSAAAVEWVEKCTEHAHRPRPVVLEAKSHAGPDAWDCGIDPSWVCAWTTDKDGRVRPAGALGPEQWHELQVAHDAGALALVVLRAWGEAWALTIDSIRKHVATSGRRTVRPGEVAAIARRLVGVAWVDGA